MSRLTRGAADLRASGTLGAPQLARTEQAILGCRGAALQAAREHALTWAVNVRAGRFGTHPEQHGGLAAPRCVPRGWPAAVGPPGTEDWQESARPFPVKFFCSTLGMSLCLLGVGVRLCDAGALGVQLRDSADDCGKDTLRRPGVNRPDRYQGRWPASLPPASTALAVRGEPVGRPGFPGAGGHDCAGADPRRCASLRGWRGGLPTGRGRAADRIGCRRPRAAGHGRDPDAGRPALVVIDKRHGFPVLREMSRGERVPGDPACAAPHPADDRGAGYVRSVAALLGRRVRMESARRSGWRRRASALAFPALAMAGSSEVRASGGRCARARLHPRRRVPWTRCSRRGTSGIRGTGIAREISGRDLTERWRLSSAGRAPGGALHALHRRGDDHVD
jgi:hypothetical protein